uniref:Profilin n=1 Tax=Rhabditophanes sp. KR3021 TaxID=114890 RepID=A0AC35UIF0_9BILA
MSWKDMVNDNLIGTGFVSKAAIVGLDGSIWGVSDNFSIDANEGAACAKGFSNHNGVLGTGLKFETKKYLVIRADDERIIGKQGADGFFAYKTKQAVIIGIYSNGLQPEKCSTTVGALADYLKSTGY